jgi:hypothetical protein
MATSQLRNTAPIGFLLVTLAFSFSSIVHGEPIDHNGYLEDCHLAYVQNDGVNISFPPEGVPFANQRFMASAVDSANHISYFFDFLPFQSFSQKLTDAGVSQSKFAEAMVYLPLRNLGFGDNLMAPAVVDDMATLRLVGADYMVRYAALKTIYPTLEHEILVFVIMKNDVGIAIVAVETPSFSAFVEYVRVDPTRMTRLMFEK